MRSLIVCIMLSLASLKLYLSSNEIQYTFLTLIMTAFIVLNINNLIYALIDTYLFWSLGNCFEYLIEI